MIEKYPDFSRFLYDSGLGYEWISDIESRKSTEVSIGGPEFPNTMKPA